MTRRKRVDPVNWLLAIWLVGVILYVLSPIVFIVINSFNSAAYNVFPPEGFSLRWYETALGVRAFRTAIVNSVIVGVGTMILSLVIGIMAARALVGYRFRGQTLVSSLFFAPVLVPRIAMGAAIFLLYIRVGLYGGRLGLVLAHTLLGLPFVVSIITAVMYNVDPSLEEAAQDLGAPPLETFFRVSLPQMRTGLIVAGLFAFIISFDELDTSLFLVRPANNTLPIEMFLYVQEYQNPTLAALSTLLIAATVVFVILLIPLLKTQEMRRLLNRAQIQE